MKESAEKKEFSEKGLVQFVGLKEEDGFEKTKAMTAATNVFEKIKKISGGDATLIIHVKSFEVEGTRKKYSVNVRVNWPGKFFEAKQLDWDFLTTTQSALTTLLDEVKKNHSKIETEKKF